MASYSDGVIVQLPVVREKDTIVVREKDTIIFTISVSVYYQIVEYNQTNRVS